MSLELLLVSIGSPLVDNKNDLITKISSNCLRLRGDVDSQGFSLKTQIFISQEGVFLVQGEEAEVLSCGFQWTHFRAATENSIWRNQFRPAQTQNSSFNLLQTCCTFPKRCKLTSWHFLTSCLSFQAQLGHQSHAQMYDESCAFHCPAELGVFLAVAF